MDKNLKILEIINILQDYDLIDQDDDLLLSERLSAMCVADDIVELFKKTMIVTECRNNVVYLNSKKDCEL